jgi:hypothetical protein
MRAREDEAIRGAMDPQRLLYLLLYNAFIAIRVAASQGDHKQVFILSNAFHTLPLELEGATTRKDVTYEKILGWLIEACDSWGCGEWLRQHLKAKGTTVADILPLLGDGPWEIDEYIAAAGKDE